MVTRQAWAFRTPETKYELRQYPYRTTWARHRGEWMCLEKEVKWFELDNPNNYLLRTPAALSSTRIIHIITQVQVHRTCSIPSPSTELASNSCLNTSTTSGLRTDAWGMDCIAIPSEAAVAIITLAAIAFAIPRNRLTKPRLAALRRELASRIHLRISERFLGNTSGLQLSLQIGSSDMASGLTRDD